MLEQAFQDVYTKFKLHFYQNVFQRFATREATLTTVESFCMEGIMAMGEPTIAEFSRMIQEIPGEENSQSHIFILDKILWS